MLRIRRIVLPIDFSSRSETALAWVLRLVSEMRNIILHLVYAIPLDTTIVVAPPPPEFAERQKKRFQRKMDTWRIRIPKKIRVETTLREGWPADVITDVVKRIKPDLLVMSTQGRYGLARLLKGSVTEAVVRRPIMILHDGSVPRR